MNSMQSCLRCFKTINNEVNASQPKPDPSPSYIYIDVTIMPDVISNRAL